MTKPSVTVALYNKVVGEYRSEDAAHSGRETIESRFYPVLAHPDADILEFSRREVELERSGGDPQGVRVSLSRMYQLGIEIGYRLGQQQVVTPMKTFLREHGVPDEVVSRMSTAELFQAMQQV